MANCIQLWIWQYISFSYSFSYLMILFLTLKGSCKKCFRLGWIRFLRRYSPFLLKDSWFQKDVFGTYHQFFQKDFLRQYLKLFFVLAFTVSQRHWLLEESIGTMDIENQAFRQLWILLSVGTVSLIFGSILSCIMFKWINSSLHPYIEILSDQIKEQKTVKNVNKVLLVSITHFNTE